MQTLSTPYFDHPPHSIRDTLGALGSPLRSIVRFFAPWTKPEPATQARRAVTPVYATQSAESSVARVAPSPSVQSPPSVHAHSRFAANASRFSAPRSTVKPPAPANSVRALRVIDGSCTTQSAGRMKIVGRFSDVCAELDRMCTSESIESNDGSESSERESSH